jgi:ABC-type dipeptide/oligopeptide/nickel transport system ATPase component
VNDASPAKRNIAMVFQNYALYPHMTVRANMELALKIRNVGKRERAAKAAGYRPEEIYHRSPVVRRILDIGLEHVADYDKKIHTLRAEMPAKDLAVFMQAENASEKVGLESATPVLNIVLAYLYSGRQTQAYRTLQKMWPPFDQERIWKLILETRREGILRYTRSRKT